MDGEWTDEDVKDPLSEMLSILGRKRDKALTQRWIVWIAKRNADGALMVSALRHAAYDNPCTKGRLALDFIAYWKEKGKTRRRYDYVAADDGGEPDCWCPVLAIFGASEAQFGEWYVLRFVGG